MILKLDCTYFRTTWGLVNMQILGPLSLTFRFRSSGVGLKNWIPNKFPGDAEVAVPLGDYTLRNPVLEYRSVALHPVLTPEFPGKL